MRKDLHDQVIKNVRNSLYERVTKDAYLDYLSCLLECGSFDEVIYTPYKMSLSEIIKRASYHRNAYEIRGCIEYEKYGVNFQQWKKELSVWNNFLCKYLPQYTYFKDVKKCLK